MNKRNYMLLSYYSVSVALTLNLAVSLFLFLLNPFQVKCNFMLILQILLVVFNIFEYRKLYIDSAKILPYSLLLIAFVGLEYMFTKTFAIETLVIITIMDVLVITVSVLKGLLFPYVKEESNATYSE